MPAPFDIASNLTAASEIFSYINSVTNYWFSYGILIIIFFVAFISIGIIDVKKGFAVASFMTAIISAIFREIGAIDEIGSFIFIIGAVVGIIALLSEKI